MKEMWLLHYRNMWYMFCHGRKKYFVLKIILLIISLWLAIAIVYQNVKTRNTKVHSTLANTDEEFLHKKIDDSEENYIKIDINVFHYKEMNQSTLHLPGYGNPGEYGEGVTLNEEEKILAEEGWQKHAFNEYVSNLISIHRRLPDVRPRGCRNIKYSANLPKTSIIICFHNEAWSVLLRTIHSVLDRSPAQLIEEIILVDDFSDLPHLGKLLEEHISSLSKVRILRTKKREGLIRARLMGVTVAKATVLTFLDAHCECTPGWLEPLLQRIHSNRSTVVCPVIDTIDDETFKYEYTESKEFGIGGFNWDLEFDWRFLPEKEIEGKNNHWDPVRSPTMPGGIFSISKRFFKELGQYDEGYEIWGGENLELSFKTWMCGGSLEIVPCSHVGHVYRKRSPYKWKPDENVFERNTIRLAEVWLDEYKYYFYRRIGIYKKKLAEEGKFGDVTPRKELRKKLNCKSFDWYLKHIYPDQYIPNNVLAEGEIRSLGLEGDTCLDSPSRLTNIGKHLAMSKCHLEGENQYFILTISGQIRRDQVCLDYAGLDIGFYLCHDGEENQIWMYDPDTQTLEHKASGRCLEMSRDKINVTMEICNRSRMQRWKLQNYEPSKLLHNN